MGRFEHTLWKRALLKTPEISVQPTRNDRTNFLDSAKNGNNDHIKEGVEGNDNSTAGIVERVRQEPAFCQHGGHHGIDEKMFWNMIQTAMEVELNEELGRDRRQRSEGSGAPNYRNGYLKKTVKIQLGEVDIKVPRDRNRSFEPKIIGKYNRNADGIEEKNLALYSCTTTLFPLFPSEVLLQLPLDFIPLDFNVLLLYGTLNYKA